MTTPLNQTTQRRTGNPKWSDLEHRLMAEGVPLMDEAAKEIGRLRTALAWYAEPVLTYAVTQVAEPRSAVHADGGRRAREALANG